MKDSYKSYIDNPWVAFIPFLFLYALVVIFFGEKELVGDEPRYLAFATNILKGYYSPKPPHINLWNGPGYPMLLAPFMVLKDHVFLIRLLNAFLLYFSLVLTFKTIGRLSNKRTAYVTCSILGLYYPIYEFLPTVLTECFTWFLISAICFIAFRLLGAQRSSRKLFISFSITLAILILTKVIFAYVISLLLVMSVFFISLPKTRYMARKAALGLALSLLFCTPYLFYTYQLTGKVFYWADSGGMSLYTMSSPAPDEYGDWRDGDQLLEDPDHTEFMIVINGLDPVPRDSAYKAQAVANIKQYPKKYLMNCAANVGRMWFSYPYTDTEQSLTTFFTILPNMFVVVLIGLSLLVATWRLKALPHTLIFLLCFVSIYLFGSTMVSAYRRMFFITLPFWVIFCAYVWTVLVAFEWKNPNHKSS
ncbi:MAG: hypothetical protein RIC35_09060 [Marinoscillum sp.]